MSPTVIHRCEKCGNPMPVPERFQDRELRCTKCGFTFTVTKQESHASLEPPRYTVSTKPPRAWIGLVLAFACLGFDYRDTATYSAPLWMPLLNLGALGFFLFCVHRLHLIIGEGSAGTHSITPWKATVFHLIPVFGLAWLYYWPSRYFKTARQASPLANFPGWILGIPMAIGFAWIGRGIEPPVGYFLVFLPIVAIEFVARRAYPYSDTPLVFPTPMPEKEPDANVRKV